MSQLDTHQHVPIKNEDNHILHILMKRIEGLEEKVLTLEKSLNKMDITEKQEDLVELKSEQNISVNIEPNILKTALRFRDYRSILIIFKHYYKKKENTIHQYPIQIKGVRKFEYFLNNKWIPDPSAHYIKKTIFSNIQTCFFKINSDVYIENLDEIIMNQDFILKLDNDKVKKELFKHVIDEVKNVV